MTRSSAYGACACVVLAAAMSGCVGSQTGGDEWRQLYREITGRWPEEKPKAASAGETAESPSAVEPAGGLAGEVSVVADTQNNAILLRGAPKDIETLQKLLLSLDRPKRQVLIWVFIAEISLTNTTDLGFEWNFTDFTPSIKADSTYQLDFGLDSSLTSGLRYSLLTDRIAMTVHALSTRGKVNVLSRPHILTLDNKEATITVGSEVPFVRNTRVTDEGTTYNTVEYEDIGIILTVTPHVNPEGWVTLDVAPEVSAITDSTVTIATGVSAPIFTKRTAKTSVAVKDGQTIVIGGMMRDAVNDMVRSVPILGDIPVIGNAFKYRKAQNEKTELLVFITPYVVTGDADLKMVSGKIMDRARVLPGTLEVPEQR